MAKHGIRANRTPAKPKSEIRAAKSFYEKTHPVGSAERFLDEAAKEALVAAAAGGVITPRQAAVGAAKAVADEAERYPDPLLAEAAKLSRGELARRAARAAIHQRAMEAQNAAVRVASAVSSPVGNMVANNAALTADEVLGTRQDWGGGKNSVERVESPATRDQQERVVYGRKLSAPERRLIEAMTAKQVLATRQAAAADADARAYRRRVYFDAGRRAETGLMEGLNPLVLAASSTSPAAMAATAAPGILRARRDLKEMGLNVTGDPDALANLASVGMMLYGAPARRIGNFKALEQIAWKKYGIPPDKLSAKTVGNLPAKDQIALKRLTRFERGAQGLGVETLIDPDVRLLPSTTKKVSIIHPRDLPKELQDAVWPAHIRGNIEEAQLYPITVRRVPLDSLQRKGEGPRTSSKTSLIFGRFRPSENTIEVAGYPGVDSYPQHEVFIHEMDHAIRYPFRSLFGKDYTANKMLGREIFGAEAEPYVRDYYKRPDEIDAFTTAARNWLTPEERLSTLRMDTTKHFIPELLRVKKDAQAAADLHRVFSEAETRQASKGGNAGSGGNLADPPPEDRLTVPEAGGPRIVINPTTFENKKDALCVAFNEGFRVWMEVSGFEPQSEPTDAQRKFFSDTAYADDEVQLRRTILARIATFDTSVKDPTDDQLAETGSFLDAILESDWCKNEWERSSVQKLARAVEASVGAEPVEPRREPLDAREPEPLQSKADLGGGETEEEAMKRLAEQAEAEAQEAAEATAFMEGRGMDPSGVVPTMEAAIQAHTEQMQEPAGAKGAPEPVELAEAQPAAQQAEAQPAAQQAEAQPVEAQPVEAQPAAQPAAQQAEAPEKADPRMARLTRESKNLSDIWTGGEVGKGRRLTKTEAEFIKNRIDRGASVSAAQRAMFEPARNDLARQAEVPEQQAEAPEEKPRGGFSDIWSGGEAGKGRRLTNVEADFIRRRIERGASVSAAQRAMFGLS